MSNFQAEEFIMTLSNLSPQTSPSLIPCSASSVKTDYLDILPNVGFLLMKFQHCLVNVFDVVDVGIVPYSRWHATSVCTFRQNVEHGKKEPF